MKTCATIGATLLYRDRGSALLSLFLLSSLIGGLKTSGWVVAFVLSAAGALVAAIHRVPARRWISGGIAVSSGAWLSSSIWNAYLAYRLPIADEVSVLPLGEWRLDLLGSFLVSVRADVLSHWPYYGLVSATCAVGFLSLIKRSLIASPTARLLLGFVSVAMSLHVASLVMTYVAVSFLDWEISRALSFQRYSAHVGFSVCVVGLVVLVLEALPYAAGFLRKTRPKRVVAWATAACGALIFRAGRSAVPELVCGAPGKRRKERPGFDRVEIDSGRSPCSSDRGLLESVRNPLRTMDRASIIPIVRYS